MGLLHADRCSDPALRLQLVLRNHQSTIALSPNLNTALNKKV